MKIVEKRAKYLARESATDRQERIAGWRQDLVASGRVLVLGAGALGNEVAKNMALMGLGYMFIADMDTVSHSNLSRAIFFHSRDAQQKCNKAELVAKRSKAINVTANAFVQMFQGDIVWQLGAGVFRRVDVVLGCLDNVEARMKANAYSLFTGVPFIDGGILGLAGNITAVHPPQTACWECTTSKNERDSAASRYDSCSKVMLRDIESGRLPTVQVVSSIVAGFQSQEAIKIIQGQHWAKGNIIQYDGNGRPDIDVLTISRRPSCWCNKAQAIKHILELPLTAAQHTLNDLLTLLEKQGYTDLNVMLPGQFVVKRECLRCKRQYPVMCPRFRLDTTILSCPSCGAEGNEWIHLLSVGQTLQEEFDRIANEEKLRKQLLNLPLIEVGFPPLALISFTHAHSTGLFEVAAELSYDAAHVMGGEQYATVRLDHA